MTLFITRYFLKELSSWVVLTPISLIVFLLIGSFSGIPFSFALITAILASVIVFSKYHETRKLYEKMFAQFPIDGRTMLRADIVFHGWISVCYILYTLGVSSALKSLVQKQWMYPSGNDLLLIMCLSLLLITISLLLIWWNLPPNTLMIVFLLIPIITAWNFIQFESMEMNLYYLLGTVGFFIVVYFLIKNSRKRRDIT